MKRQKDMTLKDELPRSVGGQYANGEEWRNKSRKNAETQPKRKQCPVFDVTGDGSKVQCFKEQYCIVTWNVSFMNQGNRKWLNRGCPEKAVAPHSSTLAWKIPWMEEPGGLQSMGSLRVRHDLATSLSLFTFTHWRRKRQPTAVFLPGESQGWGSLVGCCLWGRTESATTKETWQQQQTGWQE